MLLVVVVVSVAKSMPHPCHVSVACYLNPQPKANRTITQVLSLWYIWQQWVMQ